MPDKTPQRNFEPPGSDDAQLSLDSDESQPALDKTLGNSQTQSGFRTDVAGKAAAVFEPETIIDGKYRVLSVIGRGGMGTVYRVEQIFLHKEFALKTIHGELNESAWRRFELEAKAASKLDHPNTVRVSDFGLLENKHPFFVMELVEGTSLADYLKHTGRLNYEDIFSIFIPLCWALQDAHEKGIVHRDVKPSNVMLIGERGNWQSKLLDFGIAKINEAEQSALTQTGELIGSPLYMSPEQCTGNKVDHRSDIYSMGCTLYEAITGCPPFSGSSTVATIGMHLHEKPLSLKEASMGEEFPPALEQIVQTMLAKNPDQRFASIKEAGKSLMQLQQGDKVKIAPASFSASTANQPGIGHKRDLNVNVVLLCITIVAVGFAIYFWHEMTLLKEQKASPEISDQGQKKTVKELESDSLRSAIGGEGENVPFCDSVKRINGVEVRHFSFPSRSLGYLVDRTTDRAYNMQGEQNIVWRGPLEVRPSPTSLSNYPGFFEHFQNDEIKSIHFAKEQQFFMDSLERLHSYKYLEEISFQDTDFRDDGLKFLEQLPRLNTLNLLTTNITTEALAKFSRLKSLKSLSLGHQHVTPLLKALEGDSKMEHLMFRYCQFSKDDCRIIAALPHLKSLTIDQGYFVDGNLLVALADCKPLRILDIQHCLVDEKDFNSLGKLQQIKTLHVTKGRFSPEQLAAIRKMLRNCDVIVH